MSERLKWEGVCGNEDTAAPATAVTQASTTMPAAEQNSFFIGYLLYTFCYGYPLP